METHSVILKENQCIGCTDCIKRCPTEAIRVRNSKAQIIKERCIDCGNCIRICRNGAKKAATDDIEEIKQYGHRIALPAPSFYAQFPKAVGVAWILEGLKQVGFTDCFEVAAAAEVISEATYKYLEQQTIFPVISSACPAIVRLIQRRFPSLIPYILPVLSPMELAARYVKKQYAKEGIPMNEVGVFFISPCPAKVTEVRYPIGVEKSMIDGVLSMQDLYKKMRDIIGKTPPTKEKASTSMGMTWATRRGGMDEKRIQDYIAVDGMENVIQILEKVEDGTLGHIHYIEAMACTGGCLGGALTIENPFISRNTLKKWIEEDQKQIGSRDIQKHLHLVEAFKGQSVWNEKSIVPKPVFSLNANPGKALEMLEKIEALYKTLPQIDCGSCGAPTCRCFAEDVVRQEVSIEACIFMLKQRIKVLSDEMQELAYMSIPTESNLSLQANLSSQTRHK